MQQNLVEIIFTRFDSKKNSAIFDRITRCEFGEFEKTKMN